MSDHPEIRAQDAGLQRHHADDDAGKTVESTGQSASDTKQMQIAHVQHDVIKRPFPAWRTNYDQTVFDLHRVSKHVALLLGVVEELHPVQGGLDQIVFSARRAREELVADQHSAGGSRTWSPPPDSEWWTGTEVRKDRVLKLLQLRCLNPKGIRWPRCRQVGGRVVWLCKSFAVSSPHALSHSSG